MWPRLARLIHPRRARCVHEWRHDWWIDDVTDTAVQFCLMCGQPWTELMAPHLPKHRLSE